MTSGEESVLVAARRMRDRGVGTLIVVNARSQPIGLLSDRDVALRVVAQERDPARTPVTEVMTAMPMTILESSSIESALAQMRTGRFRPHAGGERLWRARGHHSIRPHRSAEDVPCRCS
jgi:CBS domain-containing protein